MRSGWMVALCALAACSFNPAGLVTPAGGDGGPARDGTVPPTDAGDAGDAARIIDAAPIDARPVPDAAVLNPCTAMADGARVCDGNFAGHCSGGGVVRERPCANFTLCLGGECQVSPLATACQATAQCSGSDLCTPFVTHPLFSTAVAPYCATPDVNTGAGDTFAPCTTGLECQTGVCTDDGHCFGGCRNNTDCNGSNDGGLDCHALAVHVDGQMALLVGCGPGL